MSWSKCNLITASKLNSENNLVQTGYISIGNNNTSVQSVVKFIWKPINPDTIIATYYCHSLDGWFNSGAEHEISVLPLNSSSGFSFNTGAHPVLDLGKTTCYRAYYNHHHETTVNIKGSSISHDGWYQFVISQHNQPGGEQIWLKTYSYPQRAIVSHEIIHFSSTGNRIHGTELSAVNLNNHYITTL